MSNESENIDYKETFSVADVHAAAKREKQEPEARHEPLSLWIFVACFLVVILGAGYLGAYAEGFSMTTFTKAGWKPTPPGGAGAAGVEEAQPWIVEWTEAGKKIYKGKGACIGCHQASGQGLAGQFPPLAGSEWVTASDERLAKILLHGVTGPMIVKGQPYNNQMPAQGAILSNKEIAQVMTYIRSDFGNAASFVTEEKVAHARDKYASQVGSYTQADLETVPADQMLPGVEVDPQTGLPAGEGGTGDGAEAPGDGAASGA